MNGLHHYLGRGAADYLASLDEEPRAEAFIPTRKGRVTARATCLDDYETGEKVSTDLRIGTSKEPDNVVTSRAVGEWTAATLHRPVLDLDVPHSYVPSSTKGHAHLYLDAAMRWSEYEELLLVMERVGLLQSGYVKASRERECTAVRLPWVTKADGKDEGLPLTSEHLAYLVGRVEAARQTQGASHDSTLKALDALIDSATEWREAIRGVRERGAGDALEL